MRNLGKPIRVSQNRHNCLSRACSIVMVFMTSTNGHVDFGKEAEKAT